MVCEACSESEWTRFWMSELPFASAAFLASSAFQAMTPRTLAVITSAKVMTTAVDVSHRSGSPGSGYFDGAFLALMAVPDLVAGNAREESKRRPVPKG